MHSMSFSPARFGSSCTQLLYTSKTPTQALHTRCNRTRRACKPLKVSAALSVAATNPWRVWACLTCAGAAGLWSEKTKWGKELSGPLVSTLAGLAMSNVGLISSTAVEYSIVNKYLLTMAVPLLLFSADLRRVFKDTGRLLLAFLVGSAATVIGTLVAFKALPLRDMGVDGWKVASALAARHIGGAVNYVGVAETLSIGASAQAAGLAADSLICAFYFAGLFKLASRIGPDPVSTQAAATGEATSEVAAEEQANGGIKVLEGATAVGLACLICQLGSQGARALSLPGAVIPVVTGITVALATTAPQLLKPMVPSAEGLAAILMQTTGKCLVGMRLLYCSILYVAQALLLQCMPTSVTQPAPNTYNTSTRKAAHERQIFFAAVGAAGSIRIVMATAPSLFLFSSIQIGVHLALTLGVGKLLGFNQRDLLLASNANVGGPTTAAGMAAAKGWKTSIVPSLLVGTLGYAMATFLAVALGINVLQKM